MRRRRLAPGAGDVAVMDRVYPARGSTGAPDRRAAASGRMGKRSLVPLDSTSHRRLWHACPTIWYEQGRRTPRSRGAGDLATVGWRSLDRGDGTWRSMRSTGWRLAAGRSAALLRALVALALPAAALAAYAPWAPQKSGTTQPLHGVWFADGNAGWAVGGGGTILHTTRRRDQLEGTGVQDHPDRSTPSPSPAPPDRLGRGRPRHGAAHDRRRQDLDRAEIEHDADRCTAVAFASATTGWAVGGARHGAAHHQRRRDLDGRVGRRQGDRCTASAAADASTLWVVGAKGAVRKFDERRHQLDRPVRRHEERAERESAARAPRSAWIAGNGGLLRSHDRRRHLWHPRPPGRARRCAP